MKNRILTVMALAILSLCLTARAQEIIGLPYFPQPSGGGSFSAPASQTFFVESSSVAQSDNTDLNTWTDEGSGAHNLSAVGTAPKFRTAIKNGYGAVRTTASGGMSCGQSASDASFTFCALVKFSDVSGNGTIFDGSAPGGNTLDMNAGHIRLLNGGAAVIDSSTSSVTTGVWYAIVVTYNGGTGADAIYINSATADKTGTSVQTFTSSLTTKIGISSGGSAILQADVLELRKGNAVWSSSDISGWISYVTSRYALP